MDLHQKYWYFNSALSKETCEKIITLGESRLKEESIRGNKTTATTFGRSEKSEDKTKPLNQTTRQELIDDGKNIDEYYIRDSNICWLEEDWLYDLITPYINEANLATGWKWSLEGTESMQFTKYDNDGFYGWHNDGASDHHAKYKRYIHGVTPIPLTENGDMPFTYTRNEYYLGKVRKMSVTITLSESDAYEGGDLLLDVSDTVHNRKQFLETQNEEFRNQGTIICFPSFRAHCVTPVTKGTRYSLVVWCLGAPWK